MSSEALSHDEAIGQFCGVTGADEERAKGLLEACDWNLELAINMHVDTDDGHGNRHSTSTSVAPGAGPSTSASSLGGINPPTITLPDTIDLDDDEDDDNSVRVRSRGGRQFSLPQRRTVASADQAASASASASAAAFHDPDHVRPPIPPVRQVLVQNSDAYAADMPTRRYNATRRTTGLQTNVYDAFRDFQAEAQWQEMIAQEGESSASDSSATNSNKRPTLQDLFRPPLELMFRGSLSSAREVGTQQNKWLLVNIQNGGEFPCQLLNRDVWSNQTVKDILKEHFIFWQVHHDTFEGSRFLQFYKVMSFPHVSIIDPRTGEQMKSWPTSIDHNSFCDSVMEFLTEHPSPDGSIDAKPKDERKKKNKREKVEFAVKEEDADDNAEVGGEKKKDRIKEQEKKVEPEIDDYKKYLGVDTEKISDLAVRFPDGTRDQFKFPSDSLMKALFLLLSSRGYGISQYNYVTNFPRRLLHELPTTDTLHDAKLIRETIFVERRVTNKDDH